MNITNYYTTQNRGRVSSEIHQALSTGGKKLLTFTGKLSSIEAEALSIEGVNYIWLTATHPVNVVQHTDNPEPILMQGTMVMCTGFNSAELEINTGGGATGDDDPFIDLIVIADKLRTLRGG